MTCVRCGTVAQTQHRFCERCGAALAASPVTAASPAVPVGPVAAQASAAGAMTGAPDLVGTLVAGKYRVTKLLGEGGMGAVFVAEQALGTTSRKVALKTLHREFSSDEKIRARFEREVATVAHLEHPNTIKVFDFGVADGGLLYIVMELALGRTLAETIEADGALAPERAAKILVQVCGSLEEAHSLGIVHRDLKPDNIMLIERGGAKDVVKVLDFGIAKNRDEETRGAKLTMQGTVLGTPPYMSPEQFTGATMDVRSDIYSLGIVAYEMLTGRLPFEAESAYQWATLHMSAEPPPFDRFPAGARVPLTMRDAVYRALRKNPNERFASVAEFASAFSRSDSPRVAKTEGEIGAKALPQPPPGAAAAAASAPAAGEVRPGGTLMGEAVPEGLGLQAPSAYGVGSPAYGQPARGAEGRPSAYGGPAPGYGPPQAGGIHAVPPYGGGQAVNESSAKGRGGLIALLSILSLALIGGVGWGVAAHYGMVGEAPPPAVSIATPRLPEVRPQPSLVEPAQPPQSQGQPLPTLVAPSMHHAPAVPSPRQTQAATKPTAPQPSTSVSVPTPRPGPVPQPTPAPQPVPQPGPVFPFPPPTPAAPVPTLQAPDPCALAQYWRGKNNPMMAARFQAECEKKQ
jgi:eukaryotic-like serine/threonine-protein kinase